MYWSPTAAHHEAVVHEIETKLAGGVGTTVHVTVAADAGVDVARTPKMLATGAKNKHARSTEKRFVVWRTPPETTPRTVFDMSPLPP
jgi:hypothetical protein